MRIHHLAIALAALLPAGNSLAQSGSAHLTPSRINYQEQLPDRYSHVDFTVSAKDWMERARLPSHQSQPGEMSFLISNAAGKDQNFELIGKFSHLPPDANRMIIPASKWVDLDKREQGWEVIGDVRELIPHNTERWWVPAMGRKFITKVSLYDGQWAGEIGLPSQPNLPYDTIAVTNHATWPTRIMGNNTLFPDAQMKLGTGDVHHFVFDPNHRKWKLDYASPVPVSIDRSLDTPEWPRTHVELKPTDQPRGLRFPTVAHDRDRRTLSVHEDIPRAIKLATSNIFGNSNTYLELQPGQSVEAIYLDDNGPGSGKWHPLNYSAQQLDESQLSNGRLESANSWLTRITTQGKTVILPTRQSNVWDNARVIVENTDDAATEVYGSKIETLKRREQAVFRARVDGGRIHWVRETITLDVVLVPDTGLGSERENAMELMRESLRTTNEALLNSGATFLLREAALVKYGHPLPAGMPTQEIPQWFAQQTVFKDLGRHVLADGAYVGGIAGGCSGSYHSTVDKHFVIASNVLCSKNVLREEVGKALGMQIHGKQAVPVIGSGNLLPVYPTATHVLEDGSRAINASQRDEVQHMNGVAAKIARYGEERWP
ncbi:TPA: hypothetical protein UMF63_000774 [Stenotrophomonas maltophilia]|nr:hypothetical protein [Stenotrophomonas maltophilia]